MLFKFFFSPLNKEATEKHHQDFKQLKAEKKVLEKELKKAQVECFGPFHPSKIKIRVVGAS